MALCPSCVALQSDTPASSNPPAALANFTSTKTAYAHPVPAPSWAWHSVRAEVSGLGHSPVAHAVAAPDLVPVMEVFGKQSSQFADALGTISSLYSEAGEERRAAHECMQRTAEESGRSIEDYEQRALLFERSGKMAASSKLKEERVFMELELLQGEVMKQDKGQSAADYLRRAQIFSMSAEIYASPFFEEPLP